MGIYDGLLRVYRNLRLVHMNLRLVHMNLRLVHMNALCFSSNMKTTKLLKILMIIEKIKTLSVSVSSERRRRLTPCLLTANLPKTPLGESELLEPLFRYLPREGRGPRCKFEAFFVTGSMLVSSSPFFKPSNLLKWFQTHQTLVWSGRR